MGVLRGARYGEKVVVRPRGEFKMTVRKPLVVSVPKLKRMLFVFWLAALKGANQFPLTFLPVKRANPHC